MTEFALYRQAQCTRLPWWKRLPAMLRLARQRKRLAQLEPWLLDDIGVSRADALTESRRAPWDVPSHWRE